MNFQCRQENIIFVIIEREIHNACMHIKLAKIDQGHLCPLQNVSQCCVIRKTKVN